MTQVLPPPPLIWQSFELKQWARHSALTHSRPAPHSALLWHCGVRPVLATQVPPTQVSPALVQSLSFSQVPWQKPLMQGLPPQSAAVVHWAPPFGSLTQWPPEQIWPVPQVDASVHAFWHRPLTHRPPLPHSALVVQPPGLVGFWHWPLTQVMPAAQSLSSLQVAGPGLVGTQVLLTHV